MDNLLKQYVSQNLNNMTDLQKAEAITKYVAEEYDYSGEYQDYRDMFLYKCGDCWGSANLINKISELAGLQSHTRNANQDPGAGSGHENNAFYIDGKVYIGDAGYGGSKPRGYSFYIEDPAFSYKTNKDGTIRITQYDGFETETLVIPSTINGKIVTTIARGFVNSNTIRAKNIVLPNTITTIEGYAFWPGHTYPDNLENINIPDSVTNLEGGAFAMCKKVKVTLGNNSNYAIENNVIYNKEKTKLIEALSSYNGDKKLVLPDTVTSIENSAFFAVKGIEYIILPKNMETLGEYALYESSIKGIYIPKTIKKIEPNAISSCGDLVNVEFEEGSTCEIGDKAFARCIRLVSIKIPSTITTLGKNIFQGTYTSTLTVYGEKGSAIENYCIENNHNFSYDKIKITGRMITIDNNKFTYSPDLKLDVEIKYIDKILEQDKDYKIIYDDDYKKVGVHYATILGIGDFSGEIQERYEVTRAESQITFDIADVNEGETLTPVVNNPGGQKYFIDIYNESGKRVTTPTTAGEYTYSLMAITDDYYNSKTITKKAKINPASIPLESLEAVGSKWMTMYVGDTVKLNFKYNPENTTIVKNEKWSTSNENVLKVDNDGNVTAVGLNNTEYGPSQNFVYLKVGNKNITWIIYVKERTFKCGDVNGDGEADLIDCALLLRHAKGIDTLDNEQLKRADVNNDNDVDLIDYALLLRHAKGIELLD